MEKMVRAFCRLMRFSETETKKGAPSVVRVSVCLFVGGRYVRLESGQKTTYLGVVCREPHATDVRSHCARQQASDKIDVACIVIRSCAVRALDSIQEPAGSRDTSNVKTLSVYSYITRPKPHDRTATKLRAKKLGPAVCALTSPHQPLVLLAQLLKCNRTTLRSYRQTSNVSQPCAEPSVTAACPWSDDIPGSSKLPRRYFGTQRPGSFPLSLSSYVCFYFRASRARRPGEKQPTGSLAKAMCIEQKCLGFGAQRPQARSQEHLPRQLPCCQAPQCAPGSKCPDFAVVNVDNVQCISAMLALAFSACCRDKISPSLERPQKGEHQRYCRLAHLRNTPMAEFPFSDNGLSLPFPFYLFKRLE
ncbi:hypothetical protein B0T10DRAFT_111886 [Thelonectria olida]|uniref:Uncharacterized protein n=1 Tax=Thelonectria olida TaxID=1576542 RepID=A0A9P9ASP7_9HYPO|nr:hypothetical protein B0T10DRAFT_111886 [Thelonectria olida]